MQKASEVALAFVFFLIILTIGSAAILWPILLLKTFQYVVNGTPDEVRNSLLAVAALIGVPFLIWRTLIASKQTNISREGHYTALFTKAVEQLGADKVVKKREFKPHYERDASGNTLKDAKGEAVLKLSDTGEVSGDFASYEVTTTNYEVRLGAIYALERIAQDSDRDAWPIYLTLCSYVQNNATPRVGDPTVSEDLKRNNSDIEQIFNVLDRYKGERDVDVWAQFKNIMLPKLQLLSGDFCRAAFLNCSIDAVHIRTGAGILSFDNCHSESLDARQAILEGVLVRGGSFHNIVINDCSLEPVHIVTKSERAMLLDSNFRNGKIHVEARQFIVSESYFEEITFGNEALYDPRPWEIRRSGFKNCTFIEINFTLTDLTDIEFISCQFVRCSFVRARGLIVEGNEFIDCFADANYAPGASSQYPDFDLQLQWSAWKRSHSEA